MKLTLSLPERFGITRFLNETYQKGGMDFTTLVDGAEIGKKIALEGSLTKTSDEKKKTENWVQTGEFKEYDIKASIGTNGNYQYSWEPQKDKGKEMEFTDREIGVIKSLIENKNKAKTFMLEDGFVITLAPKLGLTL